VKSNIGKESERQKLTADVVVVATNPVIKSPKLTRAGASAVSYEQAVAAQKKENTSNIDRAGIRMLDILDKEGPQDQRELFDRVAKETGLTPATVRRHVYWGLLAEEELVMGKKHGFQGSVTISRTDRERPARLQNNLPVRDNP